MKSKIALLIGTYVLCGVAVGLAQFVQYTPPGYIEPRREDTEKVLERHMTEARWKVGRVYLDPWVGLRDSGYRDPVSGTDDEGDVTINLGFGLRSWIPLGSDFTIAAHALPEYSWWREFSERNRWNGRYGAGLFGNLGRTGMELTARYDDYATYFSREVEQQVNTQQQKVEAKFEVDLGLGGLGLFFGGSLASLRYEDDPGSPLPPLSIVDRDEGLATLGLNYQFPYGFKAGLGAEYTQAEFEPGISDRSNSGTAPILLVDFEGSQIFLTGTFAYRSLTPDGDSRFVDYDGLTGRLQLSWRTLERLEVQLYGQNQLAYSFTDTWAYYEDSPIGLGIRYAITRWIRVRGFGETGTDDYTPFEEDGLQRSDDFDTLGIDFQFQLSRVWLGLGYSESDYTSNIPTFDRKVKRVGFTVGLGPGNGVSWR